ncbi:hypothetical protein [Bacillus thuringiensis]|uniref:hypothetical protein n=1 Tax=Bacillus thuringiensis TaxID=1428 RepID=UPI0021D6912F|nr:hypothetical protein [Bacillus thuringiensis]MCU7667728.1 hypothetical protein [Bacillus thuringiensis]
MLQQISVNYLKQIDDYIKENLDTITCDEVRECYQSFVDTSKVLTGIHANYKSLPEYIVHRFVYHLYAYYINAKQYDIVTNQKFLNKYVAGKNEIDIALINPNQVGNTKEEFQVLGAVSVKAAHAVKIDEDFHRANNLIWGENEDLQYVLVTFNDKFNKDETKYISDQYKIINLQRDKTKIFAHELKNKLGI